MDKAAAPKSQAPPLRQPLCAARLCPSTLRFGLRRGESGRGESSLELTWSVHEKDIKANLDNMHARYLHLTETHTAIRGEGSCGCNSTLNSQHTHTHTQEMLFQLTLSSTPTLLPCKILMHFLPPPHPLNDPYTPLPPPHCTHLTVTNHNNNNNKNLHSLANQILCENRRERNMSKCSSSFSYRSLRRS